jgi:hypothetical protein
LGVFEGGLTRTVGHGLGIAHHAGVEDDLAGHGGARTKGLAPEEGSIAEYEVGLWGEKEEEEERGQWATGSY